MSQSLDGELEALLEATARGDDSAFRMLYERTAPLLLGLSLKLLRRRDAAEDVLQDAFIRIWHNAGEYHRDRGRVLTWMASIVRYRAIDVLRRRRIDGEDPDQQDSGPGPFELLQSADDAERLMRCLGLLGERQSRSITLAFFEGLSHRELAGRLQEPLGTVKTWIRRGLASLRECLES